MAGVLLALFFISRAALAQESSESALELRGFGTLGAARSTSGQAEIARDRLQPRGVSTRWSGKIDSLLGVQANYLFDENVEMIAQVVSRYNYKGKFAPEVTELLVRYDPNAYLRLRAGRLPSNFFLYGDSRLIGYSRLAVRPNIDFFSTLAVSYLDGVDGQVTIPLGGGLMTGKLYYGVLAEKLPFAGDYINLRGSRTLSGHLDYTLGNWHWRSGMARISFRRSEPRAVAGVQAGLRSAGAAHVADAMDLRGTQAKLYFLGTAYDDGPVLLQFMASHLEFDSDLIRDQDAALFLAGYRIGEFKPFVGYSRVKSRHSRLVGLMPGSGLDALLGQSYANQHTVSMGLRWDFRRDMALKFQADAIRGGDGSVFMVRAATPRWNGRTNLFTLSLDFVF